MQGDPSCYEKSKGIGGLIWRLHGKGLCQRQIMSVAQQLKNMTKTGQAAQPRQDRRTLIPGARKNRNSWKVSEMRKIKKHRRDGHRPESCRHSSKVLERGKAGRVLPMRFHWVSLLTGGREGYRGQGGIKL